MFDFLKIEGPFATAIYKICNMIVVSAMWLLFCIPVFTSGASTTALYYTVQKTLKNDRGNSWQCFFESFKRNFKQSTLVTLILLAIAFVCITDIQLTGLLGETMSPVGGMRIFFIIVLILTCIYAIWVFSYIARFESTLKQCLKTGLLLFIMHFPITVIVGLIAAGTVALLIIMWPLVFIMPSVSVWLISYFTEKVFRRYMSDEDKELEDDLNKNWREDREGNRIKK